MKSKHWLALLVACGPCLAQAGGPAPAAPLVQLAPAEQVEPEVKHTVIEDEGSKIDELRVRGRTQSVVVTPKVGTSKRYEILMSRSGRDPVDGTGGANSAVGKRVWNVLDF